MADFAKAYRERALALDAYLDRLFVKFEEEKIIRAAEHLTRIFIAFDLDDSGSIDHYEFSRACEKLNPLMTKEDVEDALSTIDEDGDGDVTFDEFEKWWHSDHAITLREMADQELGKADGKQRLSLQLCISRRAPQADAELLSAQCRWLMADIDEVALVTAWESGRAKLEQQKLRKVPSNLSSRFADNF